MTRFYIHYYILSKYFPMPMHETRIPIISLAARHIPPPTTNTWKAPY